MGVAILPSGHVAVADARIDNRRTLIARLGLQNQGPTSDAELIAHAYARWGTDCADALIGDFAFAVWDPQQRAMYCGRDPMGVKPLYYHWSDGLFAFGSEVGALLALPGVGADLNRTRIADYVLGVESDREYTFHTAIARLPAAHWLRVAPGQKRQVRYWSAEPKRDIRLKGADEYAAAFRELFAESVRARMTTNAPLATSLSGGVDSSSVVCMTRALRGPGAPPLHTFSLVFPDLPAPELRRIDERCFVDAVTRTGGLTPHYVRGDQRSPLGDVSRILPLLDAPYSAPNLYLHWAMYGAAAEVGATVFLDGFDGDTAVSHGLGRLNGLLRRGELDLFESEVHAFARRRGIGVRGVLEYYGLPFLSALAARGEWGEWRTLALQFHRRFGVSRFHMLRSQGVRASRMRGTRSVLADGGDVTRLLRARMNGSVRPAPSVEPAHVLSERETHVAGLSSPLYQGTLEVADRCAAAFGIEPRYPFFDRRLIEFCVALPDEQKFSNGWTRLVQRRGMEGVLPAEIQWRATKSNLTPAFHRGFSADDADAIRSVNTGVLGDFVDTAELDRMRDAWLDHAANGTPYRDDALLLFRMTTLALWIDGRSQERRAHGSRAELPTASSAELTHCEVA